MGYSKRITPVAVVDNNTACVYEYELP